MKVNPYKYKGPLDPVKDKLVCVSRIEAFNRVIEGINNCDYWSILGSRQTGKTTFLRQIQNEFVYAYNIYINFEIIPSDNEIDFYLWLRNQVLEKIPYKKANTNWDNKKPNFNFIEFLKKFSPVDGTKKIIFLLDEIDGLPFLNSFLHTWRKIFHERYDIEELNQYSVIVTGSEDLIAQTSGKTSPFNIAETLHLIDFSDRESGKLIDIPFEKLKIHIEPKAKREVINQTAGHPQLLQQTCYNLVDISFKENKSISLKDVENAIDALFKNNTTIDKLKDDLKKSKKLRLLLKSILNEKKIKYFPHKTFSFKGAGAIIEDAASFCAIRNEIYREFLKYSFNMFDDSRYEQIKEVGKGGRGVVYKARDSMLNRTVAIKKLYGDLKSGKDGSEWLRKEALTTAKLKHPNIVSVYDFGKDKDGYRIIMEFIEGENFRSILEKKGKLELDEVLEVGKSLFTALEYAHKKGVIHSDIKPQNIMRDLDGVIKIVDFGIAYITGNYGSNKHPTYIIGTPHYISPEQIKKEKADHRSDIYSAGVTLYELITGEVPFKGDSKEVYRQHLHEPVPPIRVKRRDVPFDITEMIEKCLKKNKGERYQGASEVLAQIEAFNEKQKNPDLKEEDDTIKSNEGI